MTDGRYFLERSIMRSRWYRRWQNCALILRAGKFLRTTKMIICRITTLTQEMKGPLHTLSKDLSPTHLQDSHHLRQTQGQKRHLKGDTVLRNLTKVMATRPQGDSHHLQSNLHLRTTTTNHGFRTRRSPRKREKVGKISQRLSWSSTTLMELVQMLTWFKCLKGT